MTVGEGEKDAGCDNISYNLWVTNIYKYTWCKDEQKKMRLQACTHFFTQSSQFFSINKVPNSFHIIPICDDAMFDGVFDLFAILWMALECCL